MTQTQTDWLSRLVALAIALGAWVGLGITLEGQVVKFGSFFVSLWVLSGYFTILTNFLVAVVFTVLALGGRHSIHPRFLAGIMLAIVLVGVVYGVLLRGLQELTGVELISNMLLHQLIPLLVPIYWFFFTPKLTLRWTDPMLWAIYPLVYLVYALARGFSEGHFAYPFIDVGTNGTAQVAVTVLIITALFLIVGLGVVWIDRRIGAGANPAGVTA